MKWLLQKNADVNATNDMHDTPFHTAVIFKQLEVVEWLRENAGPILLPGVIEKEIPWYDSSDEEVGT